MQAAAYHILLALAEGDRHGYALMGDVERLSQGALRLGPGTLYGSIKRLVETGLIAEADQRPDPQLDDTRRRYYRLTPAGRAAAADESARLACLVTAAVRRGLVPAPLVAGLRGA